MSNFVATREPWVSLDVAAEHFYCSKRSIERFIADRKVPARKMNRLTRVRLSELEDAMPRIGKHTVKAL